MLPLTFLRMRRTASAAHSQPAGAKRHVGHHEVIYGGIVVKMIEFCRCMIVLAAVAAFALCASAAGAQTVSAADREALAGPWVGRWDSETHEYGATMSLTIGADGSVEGKIDWTLRSSNRPDYKSKVYLGPRYLGRARLFEALAVIEEARRTPGPSLSQIALRSIRATFSISSRSRCPSRSEPSISVANLHLTNKQCGAIVRLQILTERDSTVRC